jgi:ABC-type proline/glycine betaine transport system ATPase subunit
MNAEKLKDLHEKIDAGVKAAIAHALEEHRRAGRPIAIWKDGKVAIVPVEEPQEMTLRDKASGT